MLYNLLDKLELSLKSLLIFIFVFILFLVFILNYFYYDSKLSEQENIIEKKIPIKARIVEITDKFPYIVKIENLSTNQIIENVFVSEQCYKEQPMSNLQNMIIYEVTYFNIQNGENIIKYDRIYEYLCNDIQFKEDIEIRDRIQKKSSEVIKEIIK